jgi:Arc/MetJ family transcription regulator
MKRTNLVLDARSLKEALRLSGERTYSAAVQRALDDYVRRAKARQILELVGSGKWEGSLVDMRGDATRKRSGAKRRGISPLRVGSIR